MVAHRNCRFGALDDLLHGVDLLDYQRLLLLGIIEKVQFEESVVAVVVN